MNGTEIQSARVGAARVFAIGELSAADAIRLARANGERISISGKYRVARVEEWVVKHARFAGGIGMVRLTFAPQRRRRALHAARYLADHGVAVPEAGAYIEWGAAGIVFSTAMITRHLEGAETIRDYALRIRSASHDEIAGFLDRLADAVNAIGEARAYHADLAGKNVMTADGENFYFVDLDCVRIDTEIEPEERLKNVVQLLDTFYDLWPADVMHDFALKLAPHSEAGERWVEEVFSGLHERITDRHAFELLALKHMDEIFGKLDRQTE